MKQGKDVVTTYQQALGNGDWKAARSHLKDNLEFHGPLDTFHKADDYIAALQRLGPMVESVDIKKMFADGNDVAVFCEFHFKPPMPTMNVVEWYTVGDDKIARIQVVFDPRPMAGAPK
jgi:SnoaL-like domain